MEQWPLPALLSGRKWLPSSYPDARHFTSSPYVSNACQAAVLALELRRSESEKVCVWAQTLRRTVWDSSRNVFHSLNPPGFYNTGTLVGVICEAGTTPFPRYPSQFLSATHWHVACPFCVSILPSSIDLISSLISEL